MSVCAVSASAQPLLDLGNHDQRIVLIGNGFIEQERQSGYLEARLLRHALNRSITCRNLGWSGDSVWGDARPSGFQNPAGLYRILKNAEQLKPTIIFVGYGFVESFDGEKGLAHFTQGYNALLDQLEKLIPTLVLLSPTIQEGASTDRIADLESYTAAMKEIAAKRKLPFVDLFHPLADFKRDHPQVQLTSNGITLNECGYWLVAQATEEQLGLNEEFTIPAAAISALSSGNAATITQGIKIKLTEQSLPVSPSPCAAAVADVEKIPNLAPGQWTLKCDGQELITADEKAWARGQQVTIQPDQALAEKFRQAIVDNGRLFYRRSRPFNDHPRHFTYIDKDYPLYDQQLAEQDKVIAGLRHPVVHEFELVQKETPKP